MVDFVPDESPEVPDKVVELLLGDVGVAQLREVPPHVRLGEQQRHSGNGELATNFMGTGVHDLT